MFLIRFEEKQGMGLYTRGRCESRIPNSIDLDSSAHSFIRIDGLDRIDHSAILIFDCRGLSSGEL